MTFFYLVVYLTRHLFLLLFSYVLSLKGLLLEIDQELILFSVSWKLLDGVKIFQWVKET